MSGKWRTRFFDLARLIASWSKDPSTKVGAVIVDQKRRIVGMGFNGLPRSISDATERLRDRSLKYPMTVHAEVNAVLNATASVEGCELFSTHHPCADCAGVIIQSGIGVVNCLGPPEGWNESCRVARTMFSEAGICTHGEFQA